MFKPGDNCMEVFQGSDACVHPSGQAYFDAVVDALENAKETVYIAGWALDFKTWLRPHRPDGERIPFDLLLRRIAAQRPNLNIYILVWDMALGLLLAADPLYWFHKRRPHKRIHFRYDSEYPFGGSLHQKFVVIDDVVAFVGGIDLTVGRWDTLQHLAHDSRRIDPYGIEHGPFHDAQIELRGAPSQTLGDVFRTRWFGACRKFPNRPSPDMPVPPLNGEFVFRNLDVAVARTDPNADPPVREVERLFEDSIASAQDVIYIENQYLTSRALGRLLAARLREPDGPEVVVIGPRQPAGWAEEITVGILRWRVVDHLRENDLYQRLSISYPMASVADDVATYVHMKLTIIDDWFVRVGSANVSQRSMHLDSELDVAFIARDELSRRGVLALRSSLLANHLDTTPDAVMQGPLHARIHELSGRSDHTLLALGKGPSQEDRLFAQHADLLVDPSEPIDLISAAEAFVGRRVAKRQLESLPFGFLSIVALCLVLIVIRFGMPASFKVYFSAIESIGTAPTVETWVLGAGLASLGLGVGATPFIVFLLLMHTFGLVGGTIVGLISLLGGATFSYAVGRVLGRHWVTLIFGIRVQAVRSRMLRRGMFSVALLRLFPISRFHTMGAVAGASNMRFGEYTLGTLIGLLPWYALLCSIAATLLAVLHAPTLFSVTSLLLVLGGYWLIIYNTEKAYKRHQNRKRRNVRKTPR